MPNLPTRNDGGLPVTGRTRLRRALRILGVLGLSVVAVALLALVLVHTPFGRAVARAAIERWGSRATGGTLRLGRLDLALWRGEAAATAVSLRLPGVSVDVQRATLDWSPTGGRHLVLLRPMIVVRDTGAASPSLGPAKGLAAHPWHALERFTRMQVEEGRLEIQDASGAPWLVLGRFDLDMASGSRRATLRVEDAACGWPRAGLRVQGIAAEADVRLDPAFLALERARVAAGTSVVELSGRLSRIAPITATASARADVDGALIEDLAPGSGLAGRIEASAAVEVVDDGVTGTLEASSPALALARLGPWNASGRGRFDGPRLIVDSFAAAGFGGRVEASGPLALGAAPRTEVNVRMQGLDAAALARALAGVDAPVSARASGTLVWNAQGWDVESARGEGRITLSPGGGPGLRPAGEAVVRLRGRELAIDEARVDVRGARATARARIGPGGELGGRWTADLPVAATAGLLADLGSSARPPDAAGTLLFEGDLTGSVAAPRSAATVRSQGLSAAGEPLGLAAELHYDTGRLSLAPLVLGSCPGRATLTGGVPFATTGEWDIVGSIEALETRPLQKLFGLPGHGAATGTVRLTGRRDDPQGQVALHATLELPRPDGAPATEDGVAIDLEAAGTGRRVQVSRLAVELAGGRVSGQGRYDASSRAFETQLEVERVAWDRVPLLAAPARRLRGTVAGRIALAGTTDAPSGDVQLTLAEGTIDGVALSPLSLGAHADGRELRIEGAAGEVFLRGQGSLAGDWPVQLEVDTARLPLQALADAFAPRNARPLTVAASGTIALSLPLRDPSQVRYTSASVSASGRVRRVEWTLAPLAFSGDRRSVSIEGLKLSAGNASLSANGRVGLDDTSPVALQVDADLDFADLDPGLAGRSLAGKGRLRLTAAGTRKAPELTGTLSLAGVRGSFEDALLRGLDLEARFVGRDLEVDRLTAELLGGTVTAQGRIPIVPTAGDEKARCTFALQDLDLARLLDREGREGPEAPTLLVSLEGEVEAGALSLDALAARGRVTRLETRSGEDGLALAGPASVTLESGRVTLAPLRFTGTLGELEARAGADLAPGSPRGSGSLTGNLDLRALGPYLPGTTLAGSARIDARLLRADGSWRLDGGVQVDHARLSLDALNFALGDLTGALRFEGDRVALDATAAAGDGRVHAKGGARLGQSLLGAADVTLDAERVPLQYPPGHRGRASGSVHLTGEPGRYRLAGAVSLSQGYYTAEVDSKSQSLDRLEWQLAALEGGSLTDQIALEVAVRLVEPLRVRNSTLRLDVEGGVAVSGTIAQPTASGQVTLREGGELTIGRGRLRVQRGTVELNGYPAGTPSVDFEGVTRVSGVLLEVHARGPLDDLQLTLSSDRTDLSQTDLVSLLLTGRTASAAASESGVVVAEQLAVALGGVLQKGVGSALLIDVSPDRSLLTHDTDPTQRFSVGTRITQNATVMYSAALDGTEKEWIVEFNPGGGRFRLRAISEEDNSLSLEVSDRLSFDLWSRGRAKAPREIDRLAALRFEGEPELPPGTLRKAAKLKRHRRYSGLQREQAADRVRARLVQAGYRSASVDAVTERGEGGVTFLMRIDPGPLVSIEWTGDDPGTGVREAAEEAWPPMATPDVAASLIARVALVRLQAEKYYDASVTPEVTPDALRVAVRLRVSRGTRGSGVDVAFEGNRALDGAALAKGLPRPGSREFFEALDPRSARIGNDVRLAYARVGYLRARAGPPRASFDAATGRLRVTIPVRERGASLVEGVQLPPEAAGAGKLSLKLTPGQPFDLTAYVADRDSIAAWYLANGWIEAQVRGVLEPRGASVSVRYVAEAGPRPRVADIRVDHAGKTRDIVIRRSLSIKPGDYVRPTALSDSRERLTDIGVFRSVDVRAEPRPDDPGRRDVVVGLVDKPDLQVEYGLRYTTQGEGSAGEAPSSPTSATLQLAAAVEAVNPFGLGGKVRAYGFGTTDRQTAGVHLDAPTLIGWRVRTQLFLFDDNDDDTEISGVASHVRGVTAQQSRVLLRDRRSRRWHDRLRLQWGYSFKDIEYVESVEESQLIQGDRGFASLALIGDGRDNLTDPRRGLFWTGTAELARTWLASDVDYVRLYGQLFAYLPVGPLVWAQGYRIGAVPGTDPLLLIENRFHAGGPTTVRGFEQNELGPQTAAGDSLGGQAVAVLNQELRFPIVGKLKGGLFWDAGNVWQTAGELDPSDLRQSVGAGLRYTFPFGPVRLEYAWILRRREGEPAGRFVFGLGHAF